jgi:hypothetical protein
MRRFPFPQILFPLFFKTSIHFSLTFYYLRQHPLITPAGIFLFCFQIRFLMACGGGFALHSMPPPTADSSQKRYFILSEAKDEISFLT